VSITATVKNYISFAGDQESDLVYDSGELADSPAMQELKNLIAGDNEILLPDVEDFTVHGFAIIPPTANEIEPVLKGAALDTGVALSASNVSVFMFGSTLPASIFLEVDDALSVRLVWF
jgi:hypothetical protein